MELQKMKRLVWLEGERQIPCMQCGHTSTSTCTDSLHGLGAMQGGKTPCFFFLMACCRGDFILLFLY
jgi:hypothetical protein